MKSRSTITELWRESAGNAVSRSRRLVVVSSCTATKRLDPERVRPITAESLYLGQQHLRLMAGVRAYLRAGEPAGKLELRIVSAGHGLVARSRKLKPYDATFAGLPREAIRRQARKLGIPAQVRALLARPYALAILLLGDDYLEACSLDDSVVLGGPTIAFCAPRVVRRLPALPGLSAVTLHNDEARRFSCGLVSLKGELGGRLLVNLADKPSALDELAAINGDLLAWLEQPRKQLGKD